MHVGKRRGSQDRCPGLHAVHGDEMGDPLSARPWKHFTALNRIRTGTDGVTQAFGKNAFELLLEEPEQAEHFNRSMSGYSAAMMDAILAGYDFSSIRRLADIGGGHGKLLSAVLWRNPEMTGVVYDLPEGGCRRVRSSTWPIATIG